MGEILAEARRRAGLTVTEVSERTRIRETIIRGIERDSYAECGGDFYARGEARRDPSRQRDATILTRPPGSKKPHRQTTRPDTRQGRSDNQAVNTREPRANGKSGPRARSTNQRP